MYTKVRFSLINRDRRISFFKNDLFFWCLRSMWCAPVNHTGERILASFPSVLQLLSGSRGRAAAENYRGGSCRRIVDVFVSHQQSVTNARRQRRQDVPEVPSSSGRRMLMCQRVPNKQRHLVTSGHNYSSQLFPNK